MLIVRLIDWLFSFFVRDLGKVSVQIEERDVLNDLNTPYGVTARRDQARSR